MPARFWAASNAAQIPHHSAGTGKTLRVETFAGNDRRLGTGGTRGEGARREGKGVRSGVQATMTGERERDSRWFTAQMEGFPMIAPPMYRTRSVRPRKVFHAGACPS